MPRQNSSPRTAIAFLILLATLLALSGYVVGLPIAWQNPKDPAVRLEVAIQALRTGSDEIAARLLTPLAESGNATAQYWLADLYEYGLGVPQNPQKAMDLLTRSAVQSFVPAETRLGEIYLDGRLVLQDVEKAREWLETAATAGNDVAQQELSQIYAQGLGVPADPIEAYAWAAIAASSGNGRAEWERDRILTNLSADQVTRAEARAKQIISLVGIKGGSPNATSASPAQPGAAFE
jgi:TPR repeat protein